MSLRNHRGLLGFVLVLTALSVLACGTPPPCNVEPEQVDHARAEFQAAEATAQEAASEVADLEAEISSMEGKVVSAAELDELEQRLAELKKGSGR